MPNLKWFPLHIYFIIILITILKPNVGNAGRKYSKEDILKLRYDILIQGLLLNLVRIDMV